MKEYNNFLNILFEKLEKHKFKIKGLQLDHIAYYTSSKEEYDKLKPEFEKLGKFDHEAIIGNRRVGVIELYKPIEYKEYTIEAAELIEPRENEKHSSGWEHAEFVTKDSFENILEKHSELEWETGSMHRPIYSHITAILGKDLKVKFHHNSILECKKLEIEQSRKL